MKAQSHQYDKFRGQSRGPWRQSPQRRAILTANRDALLAKIMSQIPNNQPK